MEALEVQRSVDHLRARLHVIETSGEGARLLLRELLPSAIELCDDVARYFSASEGAALKAVDIVTAKFSIAAVQKISESIAVIADMSARDPTSATSLGQDLPEPPPGSVNAIRAEAATKVSAMRAELVAMHDERVDTNVPRLRKLLSVLIDIGGIIFAGTLVGAAIGAAVVRDNVVNDTIKAAAAFLVIKCAEGAAGCLQGRQVVAEPAEVFGQALKRLISSVDDYACIAPSTMPEEGAIAKARIYADACVARIARERMKPCNNERFSQELEKLQRDIEDANKSPDKLRGHLPLLRAYAKTAASEGA